MDIEKQIAYWRNGAKEDWDVAQELVQNGRTRHGLFFAHLALEKMLKALVCRQTSDLPPRIHNLVRLAELAALPLSQRQLDILAEMNAFSRGAMATRHHHRVGPKLKLTWREQRKVFQWLMKRS